MTPKRKVVITGLGALAPNGNTLSKYWNALISGKSGIGPIQSFDAENLNVKIAGELKDFDPLSYFNRKEIRKLDPFTVYHMVSAEEAILNSELNLPAPANVNLYQWGELNSAIGNYDGSLSTASSELNDLPTTW